MFLPVTSPLIERSESRGVDTETLYLVDVTDIASILTTIGAVMLRAASAH
jgi:hypothetical protein